MHVREDLIYSSPQLLQVGQEVSGKVSRAMPFGNLVAKDARCNHVRITSERRPKLVSFAVERHSGVFVDVGAERDALYAEA